MAYPVTHRKTLNLLHLWCILCAFTHFKNWTSI